MKKLFDIITRTVMLFGLMLLFLLFGFLTFLSACVFCITRGKSSYENHESQDFPDKIRGIYE